MQCPLPADDDARAAALSSYSILDTAPEHAFDRLTRLASLALRMPIVLVSLTDRDRQWFKSSQGLAAKEAPRSITFCAHAIRQDGPFIVDDTTRDPLFHDNPLVVGEPFIRSYVGIPLRMRDGHVLGTLCAMDQRPRTPSAEEIDVLQDLASLVIDAIELRRMATADSLTGALTRRGFETEMSREFGRAQRSGKYPALLALDIDHFKSVNDVHGHAVGDLVLQALVATVKQQIRGADVVARMGGEEFVVLLPETGREGAFALAERIRAQILELRIAAQSRSIGITASFGVTTCAPTDGSWRLALERADMALYSAKRSGRNRTVCFDDLPQATAA